MFFNRRRAPEIIGVDAKSWINSSPLTLEKLKGKIVLIDFWTYSCVNCVRTLPFLKRLWEKYKKNRFVIIGVHTPEFDFEKELGNVKYAIKKYGLDYPNVNDPEGINWHRYGNTYWPRAALIDSDGKIIAEHIGESGYDELEKRIIEELKKLKENVNEETIEEDKISYSPDISKETYVGSLRNNGFGSSKVCTKEGCDEYYDNGKYEKDKVNLHGDWNLQKEYAEYRGKEGKGWISFRFYARDVNVVINGFGDSEILIDGMSLNKSNLGSDVRIEDKKSIAKIEGADMYNLVSSNEYISGVIKIIPFEGMKIYSYTFG